MIEIKENAAYSDLEKVFSGLFSDVEGTRKKTNSSLTYLRHFLLILNSWIISRQALGMQIIDSWTGKNTKIILNYTRMTNTIRTTF